MTPPKGNLLTFPSKSNPVGANWLYNTFTWYLNKWAFSFHSRNICGNFLGSPVVKTALPLQAGKHSIPDWRTKIPHAHGVAKKIKILKTHIYFKKEIFGGAKHQLHYVPSAALDPGVTAEYQPDEVSVLELLLWVSILKNKRCIFSFVEQAHLWDKEMQMFRKIVSLR